MPLNQVPESPHAPEGKSTVGIHQYRHEDHAAVIKLFSEGIVLMDEDPEFRHLWEKHLHHELSNDLADIEASHVAPGGNLWVATIANPASAAGGAQEATKIVGMAGLMRKGDGVGEVRRVFVDPSCHRMGIGRKLMVALEHWARQSGYYRLFLTTTAGSSRNLSFYKSLGYVQQEEELVLWENPRHFEIVKFVMDL